MSRKSQLERGAYSSGVAGAVPERKQVLVQASILVVIVGVAWWSCFGGVFLLDDVHSITANPSIRDFGALAWLNPPGEIGETVAARPFLNFLFAVDYALHADSPVGYHVTNLAIHLAAALAVLGIIRRLARLEGLREEGRSVAFAVALFWAVHPLQTASVTYLSQRAESMAGLFVLIGFYAYLRSRDGATPRAWSAISVVAALLGALTKETAIALPALVGLHAWRAGSGRILECALEWRGLLAGYAAAWTLWLVLAAEDLRRGGSAGWDTSVGMWDYLVTQCLALGHYVRQTVWPDGLVFDFGMTTATLSEVWPQALVILGALGLAGWGCANRRPWGFALVAFFVLLAPSSSLVPVATQTIAEHRMYLALLVPLGFAVAVWRRLAASMPSWTSLLMLTVVAGSLMLTTQARNHLYHSAVLIWSDTVAKVPSNARAHNNLGVALMAEGRTGEARAEFARAVELRPNHAFALHNLGTALLRDGMKPEAVDAFRRAVAAAPRSAESYLSLGIALMQLNQKAEAESAFETAIRIDPGVSDAKIELAKLRRDAGREDEALKFLMEAVALRPDLADAHYEVGISLEMRGDFRAALVEMEEAVRLRPDWMPAQLALGNLFARLNNTVAAERAYRNAVKLDPASGDVRYALGSLLARREAFEEAMTELRMAVMLTPDHVKARANLGNCLLVTGRIAEAIVCYDEVLQRAPGESQVRENRELARELARAQAINSK